MKPGAARQAASKARRERGLRVAPVEIDEVGVPEALIKAGLLCRCDVDDIRKVGQAISRAVAVWVDTIEPK